MIYNKQYVSDVQTNKRKREIKAKKQGIAINFYMHVHNFFIHKSMCINVENEIIKKRDSFHITLALSLEQTELILMYFMMVLVFWVDALKTKYYCTDS